MRPNPVASDQVPSRRKASAPDGAAAERALAQRIAEGDERAVAELFDLIGKTLYALALEMTGDESRAEEAVEETFTELWGRRATLNSMQELSPWLLERCRERAVGHRAAIHPATSSTADSGSDGLTGRLLRIPQPLRRARVSGALKRLGPREREVVELAYRRGLGVADIARKMGAEIAEVHKLLRSGLRSFRVALERSTRAKPPKAS